MAKGTPKVHWGSLSTQRRQSIEDGEFGGLLNYCFQIDLFQIDFFPVGVVLNDLPRAARCPCVETCIHHLLSRVHLTHSWVSKGGRASEVFLLLRLKGPACKGMCVQGKGTLGRAPFHGWMLLVPYTSSLSSSSEEHHIKQRENIWGVGSTKVLWHVQVVKAP